MRSIEETTVAVLGQGYVGLPVAIRASEVGFNVIGFDTDDRKVSALLSGKSHVEDISDATIAHALSDLSYRPTSCSHDLTGFDIAIISVPTPLTNNAPDLSFIESAVDLLSSHLRPGATVILESTTYPVSYTHLTLPTKRIV